MNSMRLSGLAGGQVMDLTCENKEGVTLADLEWIHMHKTAALLKVLNQKQKFGQLSFSPLTEKVVSVRLA